ncbi:MAG: hypothetical protein KZQ66_03605 [Candidatus Thiodiazotropha sp. (ex Lucinoma aequizonata)]|nr:hypothetical protein [Candidatus Thiodiazotropha sp. (ex Lucinoma aequizonata)]MCU7889911.1 hypothetical protein [Candidatus Thiodiazotropha sp. (ex Lucinoma aequizonata)]MCU7894414.1 hypothetical protein [Candidatus Thiodiazotropha sp. (ex Lucinoma aequizonata)]MCU7899814.1 hypothetical protein [Candidatus Thiodiazotropha sp. (ex Lucinoma aequizonata)]MCU7901202.1 hypothetical protein [Candidatus Thiodiazotropha sp. (ex Lucinoma aequizonata)]
MKVVEKSTKCIRWILAFLLFLPLVVHAAASTNVNPNPGYTDDIFTFKLDLGVSSPDYTFTLELGDGGGGWIDKGNMIADASHEVFALAVRITKAGERKYRYGIYKNGSFKGYFPGTGSYSYTVLERPEPDYYINQFVTDKTTVITGEQIQLAVQVKNQGGFSSDMSVAVRYYLSNDSIITTSDDQIGADTVDDLDTGEYDNEGLLESAPSSAGTYYYGACVYTIPADANTNNNCSDSVRVTVKAPPAISNVSNASPQSGEAGSNFTFNCTLSDSLPSGYGVYLNFGDTTNGFLRESDSGGHVDMGSNCSHTMPINTTGNRLFRVGIFDINDDLVGSYSSSKGFTVTEPASQSAPTLSLVSTPASQITLGTSYSIQLSANDNDANLKNLEINWGDSPTETPDSFNLSGSSSSQNYSHTYSSTGTYTWTAVAKDHTGRVSSTVSRAVTVNAEEVTTNQLTVITSGQGNVVGVGINCGATSGFTDCTHEFNKTVVTLSLDADPLDGATFDSWSVSSGCVVESQTPTSGGGSDLRYSMTGDCQITANFSTDEVEPENPVLTVSIQGSGRVFSLPAGIDCNNTCFQDFSKNTAVGIYVAPDAGWEFSGWQGHSECSSASPCELTLRNDVNVTAVFIESSEPETDARLTNFYPKSIPQGEDTSVTLEGINLPNTLVANIHGTHGWCEQVSYSSTRIELSCNPSTVGEQQFNVKNKPGTEGGEKIAGSLNWHISVTPPANSAPSVWVDESYKKYSYVNSSYFITAKSWDAEKNLKSIQVDWQANEQWNRLAAVSNAQGQDVSFSYTPTTTGVLKIRFRAVDENGASSISETYRVQIQPQPVALVDNTGWQGADDSEGKIASNCEGNPITPANGAKIEARSLLSVNGLVSISFDLQYHSLIRGKSSVGIGWDFANAHAAKVVEDTGGKVTVHWSENKAHVFNPNNDGSYTPESHACRLDTLQKFTTGQFKLERSGRDVYFFDEFNFLKRIENEKGQGLDFDYNSASQLAKVIESISGKYIEYSYNEDGYLIQAATNGGRVAYLEYSEGRLSKITHADGTVEEFTYTELDQIHTRSLDGVVLSTTIYDEFGRAVNQDDAKSDNQKLSFNYTETTERITTKVTDKNGKQKIMVFDKDYKLLQETDAIGHSKTYQYTDGGQPTSITDGNGNTTAIAYNQYGDITSIATADGSTETRAYDSHRNLLKVTNAVGKEKTFSYDDSNNLLTTTDELGNTTRYNYDSNNQLISETSPESRTTQYGYTAGLLTSITSPKGNTRYLEYDQDGRLIAESDYQHNYTRYELDALGRKLSETDPLGNRQTWTYDARGDVLVYRDAKRNSSSQTPDNATRETRHEYNSQGDRIKTIHVYNTLETIWQYIHDGESRLIEHIDPNGNITRYERDALGRVTKTIDALGNVTQNQYDANDNVIKAIDTLNQATISSFDVMNRITQTSDALGNATQLQYDALGRVHSVTDAISRFVENSYDALSRLTGVLHPGSLNAKQGFDNDSQLTSVTTPSNDTRSLTLDNNTNVTDETTADTVSLQYQYNSNDQLVSFRNGRSQPTVYNYDAASRLVQQDDGVSTIDYTYDENHNPKQITENGITIDRQYDGFDRVTQYKENASQQRRIRYEFDKAGNLSSLVYPHTTDSKSGFPVNYSYDALNRVTAVKSGSLTLTSYQYDQKGRITTLTRGNGTVLTLNYDSADRLTSSIDKGASGTTIVEQSYTYDAIGRLTQETILPESSPPDDLIKQESMTFGADNRLLSKAGKTFDFDGDGNILEAEGLALSFNARNQLIQAGNTLYQYNAEGHRIGRSSTDNEKKTTYVVSPHHLGLTQVLRESNNLGIDRDFIYGVQGLLAQFNRYENKHYYFHYDYRGSVVAVTDYQGQVIARYGYLPFGKQYTVSGNFDTPFGYNGRDGVVADPNGLIYMRARYYSPDQHRFVSKDPLRGDITDLASLNRYAYVGGDPVNAVDPSGLARTSFTSSVLIDEDEVSDAINYACNQSDTDCAIAKTSYVVMEACYGTAEFLVPVGKVKYLKGLFNKGSLEGFKYTSKYGIKPYAELMKLKKGTGLHAHHLIEQRFATVLGTSPNNMLAIALTKNEHQVFTNAWRNAVPYGKTADVTKDQIKKAAKQIYKEYPDILKSLGL